MGFSAFVISFAMACAALLASFQDAELLAEAVGDHEAAVSFRKERINFLTGNFKEIALCAGLAAAICAVWLTCGSFWPALAFAFFLYGSACDWLCALIPDKSWLCGGAIMLCWKMSANPPDPVSFLASAALAAIFVIAGLRKAPFGDMKMIAAITASLGVEACVITAFMALCGKAAMDKRPGPAAPWFLFGLFCALLVEGWTNA